MKVAEKDLIGQIEGYPIEIVERMLYYQVEQGNQEDIEVFQKKVDSNLRSGGFNWSKSLEGIGFWSRVINGHIFDIDKLKPIIKVVEQKRDPVFGEEVLATDIVGKQKLKVYIGHNPEAMYPYIVATRQAYDNWVTKGVRLTTIAATGISLLDK